MANDPQQVQNRSVPVQMRPCPACGMESDVNVRTCPQDGTPLQSEVAVGTVLAGNYQLIEPIGAGGMGIIYKARHTALNKFVAVKLLHAHAISQSALMRFHQEAKACAGLFHPNIISVMDFGMAASGQPYMVLDYIEGGSIADVLKTRGRLSVREAIELFTQVCDGLAHAHQRGVIHRDLKPSNIMLVIDENTGSRLPKIVDFGLAKITREDSQGGLDLTKTGEALGTPLYMSPEQAEGHRLDPRSDLYSLGCVIYECLAGTPPFVSESLMRTIMMHIETPPVSMREAALGKAFPEEAEAVVAKLLSKRPEERFQTADELKQALLAIPPWTDAELEDADRKREPIPGFTTVRLTQSIRTKDSKTALLVAAVLMAVIAVSGLTAWLALKPTTRRPPAKIEAATDTAINKASKAAARFDEPAIATLPDDFHTDDELKSTIVTNPSKKKLNLTSWGISDEGLQSIKKYAVSMNELILKKTPVTDKGLQYLTDLRLHSLDVSETAIDGEGMKSIGKIATLEGLNVSHTSITNDSFAQIAGLQHLILLFASSNLNLTDDCLPYLKRLKSLQEINLSSTSVGDRKLSALSGDSRLNWLDLSRTEVSDKGLARLKLPMLGILQLQSDPKVADGFIDALGNFPRLYLIDLSGTSVTDKGIQKLAAWTKGPGYRVILVNCRYVTAKGIADLKKAAPLLHVEDKPEPTRTAIE